MVWIGHLSHPAAAAILPPDAAVRPYREGRDAARGGDFRKAVRLLNEALATGQTQPAERLGTIRFFVERYDPYYWLGVAYMGLGDDARARENLLKSRAAGVIQGWPEASDLAARLLTLEARLAPRPTPTRPPPPPPTASPTPTATPLPTPAPPRELEEAVGALAAADWARAEDALRRLREKAPDLAEADLLEAVLEGSRYLVEGKRDAAALERARVHLQEFRRRGGSRRAEEVWLSPSLRALLAR